MVILRVLFLALPIGIAYIASLSSVAVAQTTVDKRYLLHLFATSLDRPEAVAPINDTAALVAERAGRILLLNRTARFDLGELNVERMRVFYVPDRPYTEGLKDLIAVPDRLGIFLWCMTTGSAQEVRWTVGRAIIATTHGQPPTMENEIVWQSAPESWTAGSLPPFSGCRLAADGGDVVVAMGANSRAFGSGRIVRISLSREHEPMVISTGHRNPSGILFRSGVLWEIEHGPKGGDELNIIVAGGNYGWPVVSRGEPDDGLHQGFVASLPGFIDPVVSWTPAIAPSGITEWNKKLYVGALKGETVLELTTIGKEIAQQNRILKLGTRIRDVRAQRGGNVLWVLTDGIDAKLYQVTSVGQHLGSKIWNGDESKQ